MATIPPITIIADKRVPFDDSFYDMREDYTGATATMEVRNEPGGQGPAIVTLGMSSNDGEGFAITFDPAYPDPDTGALDGASRVRLFINETTLEALEYNAAPEKSAVLHYDIHLDPAGGKKFVFAHGQFIISPGVTL